MQPFLRSKQFVDHHFYQSQNSHMLEIYLSFAEWINHFIRIFDTSWNLQRVYHSAICIKDLSFHTYLQGWIFSTVLWNNLELSQMTLYFHVSAWKSTVEYLCSHCLISLFISNVLISHGSGDCFEFNRSKFSHSTPHFNITSRTVDIVIFNLDHHTF